MWVISPLRIQLGFRGRDPQLLLLPQGVIHVVAVVRNPPAEEGNQQSRMQDLAFRMSVCMPQT